MTLSARLKKWLVENVDVKASADDDTFRSATAEALAEGALTVEKFSELTTTKADEEANEFASLLKELKDAIKTKATDDSDEKPKAKKAADPDLDDDDEDGVPAKSVKDKKEYVPSRMEKMFGRFATSDEGEDDEMEGEKKPFAIRVKAAVERYDNTKSALTYPTSDKRGAPLPFGGQPVRNYAAADNRVINTPSDRDRAISGAFSKYLIQCARLPSKRAAIESLPHHDRELLYYAIENEKWVGGPSDKDDHRETIKDRKLTPSEQKALIDDSTSGGLEAAPIVFDDDVIQAPLLTGELFPRVKLVDIPRGRRIEGVATGKVTGSWGGVDDTSITLFSTASYVSAFDTTIFRWEGAITVGLDFLSDTPIDFGAHITAQYGERLLEDLDDVIATGNGTTQPEGIMTKSGTTSTAWGGSTSIGNYESLRFNVAKAEHAGGKGASAVFCGNETSYERARAIPVGASDARRLFGMDYDNYGIMQRPYAINESMANTQVFYAIMQRYRMYRRRGLSMRTSQEGSTLIRANEMLIVAMARYGGQLERGACAAVTTTAPA